MTKRLFSKNRGLVWTFVALFVLIMLHEVTAISKWVLLLPVLMATFILMTIWDQVSARQKNSTEL